MGVKQEVPNPPWSFAANLFLTQALGFFSFPTWNTPAWSISVEFWTYPLFPVVCTFGLVQCSGFKSLCLICACMIGFTALSLLHGNADVMVGIAWVRCALGFLCGIGLYSFMRHGPTLLSARGVASLALSTLLGVFIFVDSPYADIISFCIFAVLILSGAGSRRGDVLTHRYLVWIGDISYSIYLWHTLVLHAFVRLGQFIQHRLPAPLELGVTAFIAYLLVFAVVLAFVASISYRYIEVPARKWISRKPSGDVTRPRLQAA